MKKDIAEKWVAALRSGDYKQGNPGFLADDKGYCCLGVLCEVLGEEKTMNFKEQMYEFGECKSFGVLSENQRDMAGMVSTTGYRKRKTALYQLNDRGETGEHRRWSFSEIADVIEKEWEDL